MNKKLERYRQLRDKKKARLEKAQKDMDRLEQMVSTVMWPLWKR